MSCASNSKALCVLLGFQQEIREFIGNAEQCNLSSASRWLYWSTQNIKHKVLWPKNEEFDNLSKRLYSRLRGTNGDDRIYRKRTRTKLSLAHVRSLLLDVLCVISGLRPSCLVDCCTLTKELVKLLLDFFADEDDKRFFYGEVGHIRAVMLDGNVFFVNVGAFVREQMVSGLHIDIIDVSPNLTRPRRLSQTSRTDTLRLKAFADGTLSFCKQLLSSTSQVLEWTRPLHFNPTALAGLLLCYPCVYDMSGSSNETFEGWHKQDNCLAMCPLYMLQMVVLLPEQEHKEIVLYKFSVPQHLINDRYDGKQEQNPHFSSLNLLRARCLIQLQRSIDQSCLAPTLQAHVRVDTCTLLHVSISAQFVTVEMGASISKQRRLYRPFNAGEFTVAWLTFKGDAVEDEEQRSMAKKEGLLSSKLLRGLFGDMTMQCLEKMPGTTISKEAFVCILALFYEGNTEDRISYIFTMYKIILSGENKKGEGFIAEKDYLYLLNYLEEYMPLPKQLYAAFEECMIPMAGVMSNSQFITWVRRYPDVMEFLAIHLPPSPLQGSPTSMSRALNSEEFLANSDLLNNSPSCQNDPSRNPFHSSFDFIGGEDSGDEDSDGVYDSDNLTEAEMSQSSYRENSTSIDGNDELSSILTEVGAVVKDDSTQRTGAVSRNRQRTDSAPAPSSARVPHDSAPSSRRASNRSGVSRTRGVQKMGRYMGKAVGGGISRVGHVGRSILHVGKSQGNKHQTGDLQNDDPAAGELLSAGYSFSSESRSTKKYVCGYLHKVSDSKWGKKRSWHRRWFVLDRQRGILSYYRHNPANHIPTSSSHGNIVHMADSPVPVGKGLASHRSDGHLFELPMQPISSGSMSGETGNSNARRLSDSNVEAEDAEAVVRSNTTTEKSIDSGKYEQEQTPEQQQTLLYLNETHYWYRGALDLNMDSVSLLFEKTLARNAPTRYFFQVSTLALQDIDSKRGVQYKLCADSETDFDLWTLAIAEVINRKASLNENASTGGPVLSHQQRYRQRLVQKHVEAQAASQSDCVAAADSGHDSSPLSRGRVASEQVKEEEQKHHAVSDAYSTSQPKRKIPPRIVTQFSSGSDVGSSEASCWHFNLKVDGTKQCLIFGFMLNMVAIRCLASEHVLWKVFVCIVVSGLYVANIYNPRQGHRGSLGRSISDLGIDKALHGTDVVECNNPDNCCLHKTSNILGSDGGENEGVQAEGVGDKPSRRSNTRRLVKFPMGSTMNHCERQSSGRSSNVEHSWTTTRGELFYVRSADYKKSRKKEPSKPALFDFIGADLVRTESKVDPISQRVVFPDEHENSRLFVINAQLPAYGPSVWGDSSYDGPGYTLALYWRIPDSIVEELKNPSTTTLMLLKRFLEAGNDTSLTDRFKVIAQVTNQDECGLTGMAKKLLTSHNATPVLTRPQHRVYHFKDGTTELVVDIHAFSYIARRGIHLLLDKTSRLVIDVAFVIQGETEDELPEQVLGCCRLDHVNVQKAKNLP
ncbi:putative pleckstrin domain, protein ENHANCED DISEASE RESISTANCE 2, EF-hand domain pair [Plasmopara halstedii]